MLKYYSCWLSGLYYGYPTIEYKKGFFKSSLFKITKTYFLFQKGSPPCGRIRSKSVLSF